MKRLLVMGDCFYPDMFATGQLLTELCIELQDIFKVTVLVSDRSGGTKDNSEKIHRECLQNIDIIRIKTRPFNKKSKVSRIMHVVEYFYLARKYIREMDKQDIVFSISQPPILGGLQGFYVKKKHGAKLVYCIQDFNPEQAEAVGYFKFKFLLGILKKIDTNTCKNADNIVVVGSDMLDTLRKRKINIDSRVVLINNWIDEEEVYPLLDEKVLSFKRKFGLEGKRVIMYSGNMGLYYDLENIIKVIGRFRDRKEVVFAFVGDGVKKDEMKKWVSDQYIENVVFIPYQEKEDLIYSLNAADLHLVTNQKGIKGISVPSKVYGIMAVGKYAVGILEEGSEAASLIQKSGCGVVVEPGDYENIYWQIYNAINLEKDKLENIGNAGRQYLEKNLRKKHAIDRYINVFSEL